MAKFVIAGKADCPYYAKAELLADYLQKNLPDFQIFKITQHPDVWEEWLRDVCEKNKWSHQKSPIIWRELLDRGGKGSLLGGYNEFLEHAQLYYGVTSSMSTEMMMVIAQENLEVHRERAQRKESVEDLVSPLRVWITSASTLTSCSLIPFLLSGDVFGRHTVMSLTLFNQQQAEENLQSLAMEVEDLASPLLRSVAVCTRMEEAFLQAHVVILLDDSTVQEVHSLEDCLRQRASLYQLYGQLLEKNAHDSVRVIVGGKTFVNLRTVLLKRFAPSIAHNIIAVALAVEGEAKALLARKLKTASSCIKNVIIWGNITGNHYIDLRKARVYKQESAIWGPPQFSRPILDLIFDSEWLKTEFVESVQTLTTTGKHFGSILAAHSIGQFGIPEGIVFSMPVKFENGTWVVLTDLKDTEISKEMMMEMTSDLIQEKLVALGELLTFQPHKSENEVQKRDENISSITEDQEERKLSNEHKDSILINLDEVNHTRP
ncbi:putative malate dehydrogenase 1B isoform X2 [Octodon degus]|uniref:Malate dehydrogenase 1B isoform X2 n=1 Tax=Octodon degus TaxID=10160 RepID=A0A6P6E0N0_OCTDE|nr:putative malate dehydrogenase 1B isoform X2 [Octodon degus]